jgi:hypothetical protein
MNVLMFIKGSLTRDFRLQVLFHESVSPRLMNILSEFSRKFRKYSKVKKLIIGVTIPAINEKIVEMPVICTIADKNRGIYDSGIGHMIFSLCIIS